MIFALEEVLAFNESWNWNGTRTTGATCSIVKVAVSRWTCLQEKGIVENFAIPGTILDAHFKCLRVTGNVSGVVASAHLCVVVVHKA